MEQAFSYRLEPEESGGVLIQFVDVPEAHTFAPTAAEADAAHALDCLIAALGGYIKLARKIPRPSPAQGHPVVLLPPLIAAKLALYEAMRAQRITRTALAHRFGLQEHAVHRLLDLDHRSHIARALAALGKRLEVFWSRRETPASRVLKELNPELRRRESAGAAIGRRV
jgi:antitoxin HicB